MHNLQIIREVTEKGRKAFAAGVEFWDCPYSPMTDNLQVIAWEKGWKEAERERKGD